MVLNPSEQARGDVAEPLRYERRLDDDPEFALAESSRYFEEKSGLHEALREIAGRLDKLAVPYAVAGGLALFMHGYRRTTEDVDILVGREDIKRIHQGLEGLGYKREFRGGKNLRDTEHNIKIEFLLSRDFPGDGRPKPVAFPEPGAAAVERGGIKFLALPTLVELKLASGMTSLDRLKDLTDVQELIKIRGLPRDFGEQLHPYVREKYAELWQSTRSTGRRYVMIWRNKFLTVDAKTGADMVERLREGAATLAAMLADGVELDPGGGTADDYACLVTTDPEVARKYDMHDESELLPEDEDEAGER